MATPASLSASGKKKPGHISNTRLNIISGGSPVATQMVHGAGAAYALKMDGTDKVVMTNYGEGAGSEGDTHEAFNFAAIYKLPEIFVCENNGFAISTPFNKEYAIEHVAQRAAGYGFPGVTVDGLDVRKAIDPPSGVETEEMNMVAALRSCLTEEMERDERVMVLGEDVGQKGGVFLVTDGLRKRFGEARVIDTPLAESSIAGVGLGLALAGKRPVAEMQFADFAHMAFNQITNEIAKFRYRSDGDWSVPMVIRAPFGGHAHGALYHSQSIEARVATPGLKIVIPSSPYNPKQPLLASIRDPDPVLFFEHKRLYRMFKEAVP